MGWGSEGTPVVLVHVARPDGTVDLATVEEIGGTCKTSQGDSSPLIFAGEEKPTVHSLFLWMPIPTNSCGQIAVACPKNDPAYNEVFAMFNDQGVAYRSDTVRINCNPLPSVPVVLTLKPAIQSISQEALPPDNPPLPPAPEHAPNPWN